MTLRLNADEWKQAAEILKQGGTVAFPTETVYGLGADATKASAIEAIFHAKGRPSDNPLIVHLRHPDQLELCCQRIPQLAIRLFETFCPGPLTLVLPKKSSIVDAVTAGLKTVAVRFPSHPTAQRILEAADIPVAAPSANRSGRPSATSWQAVIEDLDGLIDAVLCDGPSAIGLESTVLDLSTDIPVVLRHGAITLEQLREIEPSIAPASGSPLSQMNSPGIRHRHYQPRARVILCVASGRGFDDSEQTGRCAFIGMSEPDPCLDISMQLLCRDLDEYGRALFDFFRRCDAAHIETIYCQRVEEIGLGRALMDRLRRAAQPH